MTLEELKEEAKKQGYGIHKLQRYIPVKRCRCGKKPILRVSISNAKMLKCSCGMSSGWQRSETDAKKAWNEVVG